MKSMIMLAFASAAALLLPQLASSHCDTMNGPVVLAAKKALETGNVNLVLVWVQRKDEGQIREAFQKTVSVRKLSPQARDLADMYFFETLVRVHRAGEGAPYTGLKPAGTEVDPGIEAADAAIAKRSDKELMEDLSGTVQRGVRAQFEKVVAKKDYATDDVEAGRGYVKAYVEFIHYIERLYQASSTLTEGHYHEAGRAETEHEAD